MTRVVAGMVDPDPRVSGLGLKYLRDKGIEAQLIPEPEGEMCRDINAPFVFRVLHNRAYAAVWRSLSKLEEGDVNSASGASRGNGNINGKFGNDITSLIEGILPEVNAVVLTASQLDRIHITGAGGPGPAATNTNGLVSLPSHTAVFVVLSGDCDNTNTVTEKIRDLKAAEELSSVNRTWIVVADTESPKELAGIDLKILPSHKSKGSGCFGDVNSLLDVIASSGYNAALIIADSDADLHYLHRNAAVQKLVLTATADVPFSDEDADADPSTASSISGPNEGEFIESCESVFNGLVGGDASCRVHPSNVITKNSLRVFVKKIWSQGDAIDVSKNDL